MEEDLDKKLKEIRKILDDPFHSSTHRDRYLATLKKRLLESPPAVDSPHIVIFSKDTLEEEKEKIEEEFIVKEREGEIVEGETLFTIEREETASIPEFIEIKPEVSKIKDIGKKDEKTEEFIEVKEEEEIPEFIEVKPEDSIKKSTEEKEEKIQESIEMKTEEKERELPEWEPVEKEVFEEKVEEKEKAKKPVEKKKKTREKKRRKRFQIWEPAEEKKITKGKKRKSKKETESFEPFFEEDFEEEIKEEKGEKGVCKYKGYTLYRKEIILNDGSKRVIHFFSKEKPDEGEPSPLPDGYEIKMDKKTGIPFIRKKR